MCVCVCVCVCVCLHIKLYYYFHIAHVYTCKPPIEIGPMPTILLRKIFSYMLTDRVLQG